MDRNPCFARSSPGSYPVTVQACNLAGCIWSLGTSLTVTSATPPPVSASISLSTNSVAEGTSFTATWTGDNSPTSYNVKVDSTPYPMGATTAWTGTPAGLSLTAGNTYSISVQACNAGGCSIYSPAKTLTVTAPVPAPTTATLNLSVSTVVQNMNFTGTWTGDNSPTGYNIDIDGTMYPMGSASTWT